MYPGTHAAAHPDKPAIVMDQSGESVSYAQLEDRSVRLANALRWIDALRAVYQRRAVGEVVIEMPGWPAWPS